MESLSKYKHSRQLTGGFCDGITGQVLSFSQLKNYATYLSSILSLEKKLKAQDNVAVVGPNMIWYPVAVFASIRLGATVSTMSPEYTASELADCFRKASTKLIFTAMSCLRQVIAACADVGIPTRSIIVIDGQASGYDSLQDLLKNGKALGEDDQVTEYTLPKGESNSQTCAFLSFSSGTTGLPKVVMISHKNVISQVLQMRQLGAEQPCKVLLGVLPFYHITGLVHLLHLPIILGQDVILMRQFTMTSMLDVICKHHCEELWLVPPLLIRLVSDPEVPSYDLSHVRQFNTGAAPLAAEIITKLAAKYPDVAIRQAWGMTESCSCLTVTPRNLMMYKHAHTVGKIVPGTTIKVVDPITGLELPMGSVGELLARGPQVTMGYLDNAAATRDTYDSEGYLHTGDLGSIDKDGWVTIHDRMKEMIKVKGNGVAPAELEDLLLGHLAVQDVAVIGVPDTYSGEAPKAFVVLAAGVEASAGTKMALRDYVRDNKTRYKWLSGGVEFLDKIPKSAAGKILRKVLRERERGRGAARL
ncbi:acetyl-CoA synthetase-like protein [Pyrenochaeta sp. DS3sAY3a]|nr:acetyl-CoA synthetase-like protein [Pyrenochaeta sp. DS3sAY3a]